MFSAPIKNVGASYEVRTRGLSQHIQGVNLTHLEVLMFKVHGGRGSPCSRWDSRGGGGWPSRLAMCVLQAMCGVWVRERLSPYLMCQLLC